MGRSFQYVSLCAMHPLMDELSFEVTRCADVLDGALTQLNKQAEVPDKIIARSKHGGNAQRALSLPDHSRFIVDITQSFSPTKGVMHLAQVIEKKDEKEAAPATFFTVCGRRRSTS